MKSSIITVGVITTLLCNGIQEAGAVQTRAKQVPCLGIKKKLSGVQSILLGGGEQEDLDSDGYTTIQEFLVYNREKRIAGYLEEKLLEGVEEEEEEDYQDDNEVNVYNEPDLQDLQSEETVGYGYEEEEEEDDDEEQEEEEHVDDEEEEVEYDQQE